MAVARIAANSAIRSSVVSVSSGAAKLMVAEGMGSEPWEAVRSVVATRCAFSSQNIGLSWQGVAKRS